jgi:hypothetical protein
LRLPRKGFPHCMRRLIHRTLNLALVSLDSSHPLQRTNHGLDDFVSLH